MKEYFKQQLNQNIKIDVLLSLTIIGIFTSLLHLDKLPMLIIYPLGMAVSAVAIVRIAREAIVDAENFYKRKCINKIKSNAWVLIIAWPTLIFMLVIAISKGVVKFVKELI